jgi:peroxiredoxin
MFGCRPYNYDTFTRDLVLRSLVKLRTGSGPRPGESAPDFEARTLDGDRVRLHDFFGDRNTVLTFGSATCPFTAACLRGLNQLYCEYDAEDVQFLFVYVREAHPGERLPAHRSWDDKYRAAELLRRAEDVEVPIVVDDLEGRVHKKYGSMPNPTFVVDRSGRVAFRQLWTRPKALREALEELLEVQEQRDRDHAVVGDDKSIPVLHGVLHLHRALERGGHRAFREYYNAFGVPGRVGQTASRMAEPVVLHPGRALAAAALAGGVVAGGIGFGLWLRHQRFRSMREPYRNYKVPRRRGKNKEDYAVGI